MGVGHVDRATLHHSPDQFRVTHVQPLAVVKATNPWLRGARRAVNVHMALRVTLALALLGLVSPLDALGVEVAEQPLVARYRQSTGPESAGRCLRPSGLALHLGVDVRVQPLILLARLVPARGDGVDHLLV